MIQRVYELRLLLWAGAVVFTAGAALDLAAHALLPPQPFPLVPQPTPAENLAHLVTFAGMVLLLAGILVAPRRPLGEAPAGELANERR